MHGIRLTSEVLFIIFINSHYKVYLKFEYIKKGDHSFRCYLKASKIWVMKSFCNIPFKEKRYEFLSFVVLKKFRLHLFSKVVQFLLYGNSFESRGLSAVFIFDPSSQMQLL